MRAVIFGEVLFDHFPDGSRVLGGAPFNVAWHLQAFGLNPLFVSRIGNDAEGNEILTAMQAWGMDTSGLQIDNEHATGSVKVSFEDGEPQYDIVYPCAYDFIMSKEMPTLPNPCILYHGSLALRHPVSEEAMDDLQRMSAAPRFVDINLRPPWWTMDLVRRILDGARWIKLNADELNEIAPEAADNEERLQTILSGETVFVALTRGAKGAAIRDANGWYGVHPLPDITFVDAVGAGDAFSSILLAGIVCNWSLAVTIERAQHFASAIVGIRGATSGDHEFYRPYIDTWFD